MKNLLIFISLLILPAVFCCPDAKALSPCTCRLQDNYALVVTCSGLDNPHDLKKAFNALAAKGMAGYVFIEDSTFNYLPHDIFKGVTFAFLILRRTTIMSLTDTEVAFENLGKNLLGLSFEDLDFMNEWKWSTIKHLDRLMEIHFKDSNLEAIRSDVEVMASTWLSHFNFINCGISEIDDNAFSKISNLKRLGLSHNYISHIKRSMLPKPAGSLERLDLSYNELQELPSDIFSDMPRLINLDLYHNQIVTLSEFAFKPIWKQLEFIDIRKNEISCDCRLRWMLKLGFPEETAIICGGPKSMAGKNIESIDANELEC